MQCFRTKKNNIDQVGQFIEHDVSVTIMKRLIYNEYKIDKCLIKG